MWATCRRHVGAFSEGAKNERPHSHVPEQDLDFAVGFGGRGGIVCSTDVIEGQGGPPRLGESRHLDLVAHILVVRIDGVGPLVSRPNEVWSTSKFEPSLRTRIKKGQHLLCVPSPMRA